MKTLEQHLSEYAKYHRDQRNIYTHYIGIPLIVFSVFCLLSRPYTQGVFPFVGEFLVSPAVVVWFIGNAFYLKLDLRLGAVMALITAAMVYLAQPIAMMTTSLWLSISIAFLWVGGFYNLSATTMRGKNPLLWTILWGLP